MLSLERCYVGAAKRILRCGVLIVSMLAALAAVDGTDARAATVNNLLEFDVEIDPQNHYWPIEDGYGGLTRWGFTAMPLSFLQGRGYSGIIGNGAAWSQWGSTGVASDYYFDLNSVFLGAVSYDSSLSRVTIVGFRDGMRIYQQSLNLRQNLQNFIFSWTGINNLGFYGADGYVLDNMNVSLNMAVAPIPVPAALPMFAGALAGIGLLSAYRKKKKAKSQFPVVGATS